MSGLDMMKKRLMYDGGDVDGRLVQGKYKSFHAALKSYQGEWITLNGDIYRCLINPDKLKEDYDTKMISIDFASNIKEGDVILWNRTGTHWLVYLQQYSEEAYFRAQIRKCSYQIQVGDNLYWVSLQGPEEGNLAWKKAHNIAYNDLNYSLTLYIPKNEETNELFKRHKVIKFDGHNWKVAAVDRYSQTSVLEVTLEEYFDNEMEDAQDTPEIVEPDITLPYIDGPRTVYPYDTAIVFSIQNASNGEWLVNSNKVKIISSNSSTCSLDILTGKSGSFILTYQIPDQEAIELNVKIDSL